MASSSQECAPATSLLLAAVGAAVRATLLPVAIVSPLFLHAPAIAQLVPTPPVAPAAPGTAPGTPSTPTAIPTLEGLPIVRVEVVGNTRTDTGLILAQVRAQPGQPYSKTLIDVDTHSIAALDRFVTVRANVEWRPESHGVVVYFIVEERPIVAAVEITGNRKFSDSVIREGLIVHAGVAADDFRIQTDRQYIIDLYQKKGYEQVSVSVDQKLLRDKGIVRYQIIEGPASRINAIVIEGNSNLSKQFIRWHIQTKTYFWIFRKGLLEEDKLQQDVITIRDEYVKRGYLDARVSYSLDYNEDKSHLTVRFIVIEGMRYRIGKINLTGNNVFAAFELLGDTSRFGPGSYLERDKQDLLQRRIEDVYGHQGYINRNVEITYSYTDTPGVVDLNIKITEGSAFIVGRVIVRGNASIQDRVIRREIRIYPDQTFDMVQVRKSIERIKATRVIKDVKITPYNSPGSAGNVQDALVEVQEGQTGKFLVGAGISTNSGLVGQVSIEQQNFDISNPPQSWGELFRGQGWKGAGQFFRILLEPGTEFQRYRITFEEPHLFDTAYSFSNDLYFFTRARESWDETRIGDLVTLGRHFGDIWSASLAFRAEDVKLSNPVDAFQDRITQVNFPIPAPNGAIGYYNDTAQEILNEIGTHFLTSIKPAIARDTTDSRVFPTEGTRTSFSIEQYGAMGGSVDMTKIVFGFDWYQTVYTDLFDRKTVFSLRNSVGFIPLGTSPTYERFYLGGIGELRGFKFRGVGPRDGPLNDPIGGDFYFVTTAELNYPIYENLLRGVVFTDIGTDEPNVSISQIRSDIGLGVRISLPFFGGLPLALDFAYPTTKTSFDRTQLISVSLGASF
jgi:outer membrane protein insertion porin family